MTSVGPRKTFRTVKSMFQRISENLKEELNITRSWSQCQNRYKTIMRRKKDAVNNNNSTGRNRITVLYEAELSEIATKDDSILPEVLMGTKRTILNKKTPDNSLLENINDNDEKQSKIKRKKKEDTSINNILKEAYAKKEEGKERRHKEKMELLMKFIEKQVGPLDA
ncbi:uncharacterized protein LOC112638393 [Camponotus floridanus]|uniref:uncharacterized protein LOC112638393 n=1 Tax=Camponotus floridanus TaxID=104421 RepID=UPI000DC6C732|nr:uncharacterized protein LOC112638393 [Camponotus floridanus]